LAALILALLGVGEDDIAADFALTERAAARLIADWHRNNPDAPPLWPGYGRTPAGIMRLFLADVADRYGSLTGYAYARLAVDGDFVTALRHRLLQP
jgi:protein-tyrosine phosphatase